VSERRAPLIGLVALAAATAVTAVVFLWISSDWQFQANTFYTENGGVQLAEEEYEAINRLSYGGYQLFLLSTPLFLGAFAAGLALLAVLAWRWDRRPIAAEPADAGQATAAS